MYEAKDYETRIWWSREDDLFIAQVLEMPGVMAHGDTRAEAAASIQEALEGVLAWKQERAEEVPAPTRLVA
jgi:predicted RNase H-like HicB family nuclease